jgi:phosphoribosylaminoimidazole-succinocarboxamide synthase
MGVKEGMPLKSPIIEFYYKNDALQDPMINEYHIEAFDLADSGELKTIKDYCLDINSILSFRFSDIGLTLVDIKLEFGTDKYDQVILTDEISPDTFRVWDAETGNYLDKDLFRRDIGGLTEAYQEILKRLQGGNE